MTNSFDTFINRIRSYLSVTYNDKEAIKETIDIVDYIDDFFCNHLDEVDKVENADIFKDEDTIVSNIWELSDRFEEDSTLCLFDDYCIDAIEFKSMLYRMLCRYNLEY